MDMNKLLDYGSTVTGGGLGMDGIYEAINALGTNGATAQEWIALVQGIMLIIFGFVAWRGRQASTVTAR